ncbi:MAG: Arm DNA-binding domain-containing protein, partial [Acidobacteriaceae bacterium]
MAINLLTNTACINASCPKKISVRKLHDGGGLYLWVLPDGGKYWRLRYRQQGKEKLLALGVYPRVGLKD